jgi:hypothetical protein
MLKSAVYGKYLACNIRRRITEKEDGRIFDVLHMAYTASRDVDMPRL